MSRCRRTDELLGIIFADEALTSAQTDHAAGCPECARALALARRFDGELHRASEKVVMASVTTTRTTRRSMWRGALVTGSAVAVIALVIGSMQLWRNAPSVGPAADRPRAEQLAAWLERALIVAHADAQPGGTSLDGWGPGRVELCGDTAIAFFARAGDGSHGYLWAIGRPSEVLDESIETGWSRSLSTLDVARRRAALPVCDLAQDDVRDPLGRELPVPAHVVVRVPDLFWIGRPDAAPIEVETVGDPVRVDEVGIAREAYLFARLEDASIGAVDIVAPNERFRYTVAAPGFTIWANVVDTAVRFELRDRTGDVVRSGPIVDWRGEPLTERRAEAEEAARRHAAEAARRAAAEVRADEARASGQTCRDWRALGDEAQVLLIEELILDRVEAVRVVQQLDEAATFSEITAAAQASVDKGCQASAGSRFVTEIVAALYPDE